MSFWLRISSVVSLALLLAACDRYTVGTCNVVTEGSLITIARVQNALNDADVPAVTIGSVVFDGGVPFPGSGLLAWPNHHGVTVVGDSLRCEVACGFGMLEGTYSMSIHAAGYRDTTLTFNATYSSRHGGCPLTLSDGKRLELRLLPRTTS